MENGIGFQLSLIFIVCGYIDSSSPQLSQSVVTLALTFYSRT